MDSKIPIVCWTLIVAALITAVFPYAGYPRILDQPSEFGPCSNDQFVLGTCVQNHMCDRVQVIDTTKEYVISNGFRIIWHSSCVAPFVCCKFVNNATQEVRKTGIRKKRDVRRQGCGWRNENGIGNDTVSPDGFAKPGEFPWMVNVVRVKRSERQGYVIYKYVGGGFLIHEKVVLTAAHVIASENVPTRLYAAVGNHYSGVTDPLPKMLKKVETFDIHEQYRQGAYENDIALIIIIKPVQWLPHIGYICLPALNAPVTPGTKCFTSGWGKNSEDEHNYVMGKAKIPVLSQDSCLTSLHNENSGKVYQNAMCAGGEVGKDTCKGDGGSPLACPIEGQPGRYMASGVLSWRMSCGLDGKPSVYVDVARYRQWIDNKMIQRGFTIDSYTQY